MLEITGAIAIAVVTAVCVVEYFRTWRPRLRDSLDRVPALDRHLHTSMGKIDGVADQARELVGRGNAIADQGRLIAQAGRQTAQAVSDRIQRWLQGKAAHAEQRLQQLEGSVLELQGQQVRQFCQKTARGIRTLRRMDGEADDHLLRCARDEFRNGLADLQLGLGAMSGQALLQNYEAVRQALHLAAVAGEGERLVLGSLGRHQEIAHVDAELAALADGVNRRMDELGDLSKRVLPPLVRAGCGGRPGVARRQLVLAAGALGWREEIVPALVEGDGVEVN